MRVAHVSDFYLVGLGGIEMHISDLARRQRQAGHEVRVLTSSPGPADPGVTRLTGQVPSTCCSACRSVSSRTTSGCARDPAQ